MHASASSDTSLALEEEMLPSVRATEAETTVFSRIDFALVADRELLVYGWIVGLSDSVHSIEIELGGMFLDLLRSAKVLRRPDVAEHFGLTSENESHGFYALLGLPDGLSPVEELKLHIALHSGKKEESRWPVSCTVGSSAQAIGPYVATLKRVLPHLSQAEATRLVEFASPVLGLESPGRHLPSLLPPAQFEVDLCCVVDGSVLVVSGWLIDPVNEVSQAEICVGESVHRFLEQSIYLARPDIVSTLVRARSGSGTSTGFFFAAFISEHDAERDEVVFSFAAGGSSVRFKHPLRYLPHEARRDILSLLNRMEADSALLSIDHMTKLLADHPEQQSLIALLGLVRTTTIERLPLSFQQTNPRCSLHVDRVIPVADSGIFLSGWFNAESAALVRIVCHNGESSFVVSDNWSRHTRTDVTVHLAGLGIYAQDNEHGYCCYVPIYNGKLPYYLSVEAEPGQVRLLRITVPDRPESALQTVRTLATSFNSGQPELRFLMDRHIGPAIRAAWAARNRFIPTSSICSYGKRPSGPSVSIIVPLYGRYDFAQHQLALFADDAEFQGIELIYVVDDPAIFSDFTRLCPDLYGIYRVPFVVAFPGANLGFAGANNFASTVAVGKTLIFMNSDVLPKRKGWVGDLVAIYKSLQSPGVLGTKLIYEDGSVQHAGMAFRRYTGWGDLWINDHPFKGLSPVGLNGLHELDAVTAACAVVDAVTFRDSGGFSEDYIIGDFEDSDLCLRLHAAGRRNYITLDVELYHLERQSQNRLDDVIWRTNLTLYNCWLHNTRWGDLISSRIGESYSLTV